MALRTAVFLAVASLLLLTPGALTHTGENLRTSNLKSHTFFVFVSRAASFKLNTTWRAGPTTLPVRVSVENVLSNMSPETYFSSVVEGGVLLGALRRLQETQHDFKCDHPWHSLLISLHTSLCSLMWLSCFSGTCPDCVCASPGSRWRRTQTLACCWRVWMEYLGVSSSRRTGRSWQKAQESTTGSMWVSILPRGSIQHIWGRLNEL